MGKKSNNTPHRVIAIPYIMAPNETATALSISADHTDAPVKPSMDPIAPNQTLATSTASASAPLDVGPSPPSPLQPGNRNMQILNMKSEADRRRTFEDWPVAFMDTNRLSAAGFYFTNRNDVVRCAFCGVEVGRWEEGDDAFRDHQRWSPSCGFLKGLRVGNIPIASDSQPGTSSSSSSLLPLSSQETSRSYDVCGPYMELRPNSGPEQGSMMNQSLLTAAEMQKHGINQCRGPQHPSYNTYDARLLSYESWPRSLKQKPDRLSEAGFYYTGKGDQTVCFSCGGGLRDWEETDDPWVEHAAWFPKCMHVVLIKGQAFIEECRQQKEPKAAVKDHWGLLQDTQISQESSSSMQSVPQDSVSTPQENGSDGMVIDDARVCLICYTEERGVVFLPCGHLVACVKCAPSLSTCAVCRQPFTGTVRAFLS